MVHTFSGLGRHFALDVESGALHVVDKAARRVLRRFPDTPPGAADETFFRADPEAAEAWPELRALAEGGQLYTRPKQTPPLDIPPLKALCLHVAHDCDLRCGYCFAGTGPYGGRRGLMPFETARAALELLVSASGGRRNLEIDFFGGEPLLAMDTVRRTVAYAREREEGWGKRFRFTLTTNGLGLTDEHIGFLNAEMDNVVLSLDGRPETNDAARRTASGEGSYDKVLPRLRALTACRERDYFVRGTFTARNPDFVDDLLHLAGLGFRHLSMEPVVLPDSHPLALRDEHMDTVCAAYDRLAEIMRGRDDFDFFHFSVDPSRGPCLNKRLRGCGAGFEYAAVSPEGALYPCHQFVGRGEYLIGRVEEGITRRDISRRFAGLTVRNKPACADCWAKYHCSGGCAAAGVNQRGAPELPYELGCRMQKKRLECALALWAEKIAVKKPAAAGLF